MPLGNLAVLEQLVEPADSSGEDRQADELRFEPLVGFDPAVLDVENET